MFDKHGMWPVVGNLSSCTFIDYLQVKKKKKKKNANSDSVH